MFLLASLIKTRPSAGQRPHTNKTLTYLSDVHEAHHYLVWLWLGDLARGIQSSRSAQTKLNHNKLNGEQGWRCGDSTHLNMARVRPRTRGHMWVKLVDVCLLFSERFFLGFSGFPFFPQTSISKFQFYRMQDLLENHFRVSGASYVSTINYCYC